MVLLPQMPRHRDWWEVIGKPQGAGTDNQLWINQRRWHAVYPWIQERYCPPSQLEALTTEEYQSVGSSEEDSASFFAKGRSDGRLTDQGTDQEAAMGEVSAGEHLEAPHSPGTDVTLVTEHSTAEAKGVRLLVTNIANSQLLVAMGRKSGVITLVGGTRKKGEVMDATAGRVLRTATKGHLAAAHSTWRVSDVRVNNGPDEGVIAVMEGQLHPDVEPGNAAACAGRYAWVRVLKMDEIVEIVETGWLTEESRDRRRCSTMVRTVCTTLAGAHPPDCAGGDNISTATTVKFQPTEDDEGSGWMNVGESVAMDTDSEDGQSGVVTLKNPITTDTEVGVPTRIQPRPDADPGGDGGSVCSSDSRASEAHLQTMVTSLRAEAQIRDKDLLRRNEQLQQMSRELQQEKEARFEAELQTAQLQTTVQDLEQEIQDREEQLGTTELQRQELTGQVTTLMQGAVEHEKALQQRDSELASIKEEHHRLWAEAASARGETKAALERGVQRNLELEGRLEQGTQRALEVGGQLKAAEAEIQRMEQILGSGSGCELGTTGCDQSARATQQRHQDALAEQARVFAHIEEDMDRSLEEIEQLVLLIAGVVGVDVSEQLDSSTAGGAVGALQAIALQIDSQRDYHATTQQGTAPEGCAECHAVRECIADRAPHLQATGDPPSIQVFQLCDQSSPAGSHPGPTCV